MNILVLQSTESGLYYHRQFVPHVTWLESGNEFSEDKVAVANSQSISKIRDLVQEHHFDIVQYSVGVVVPQNFPEFFAYMKRRGACMIIDVDDLYHKRADVKKSIEICDAMTTVSDNLRSYYNHYSNKYAYIIENGINSKEMQWKPYFSANEEPVFGYLGSTRHEEDLKAMNYDFSTRPLFTVCEEYKNVLDVSYHSFLRGWMDYAWEYNGIDVALAPLVPNKFTAGKSFLKVIEAGFKKRAIITSDLEPYSRKIHSDVLPYFDRIPVGKSWKDRIESFTLEEARQRGEELYKAVQPYEVRQLNKKRRAIYEEILKKHRR
jgi:hypothetical protein